MSTIDDVFEKLAAWVRAADADLRALREAVTRIDAAIARIDEANVERDQSAVAEMSRLTILHGRVADHDRRIAALTGDIAKSFEARDVEALGFDSRLAALERLVAPPPGASAGDPNMIELRLTRQELRILVDAMCRDTHNGSRVAELMRLLG